MLVAIVFSVAVSAPGGSAQLSAALDQVDRRFDQWNHQFKRDVQSLTTDMSDVMRRLDELEQPRDQQRRKLSASVTRDPATSHHEWALSTLHQFADAQQCLGDVNVAHRIAHSTRCL
eukprot:6296446-Prymnesium_polylepis.2